MIPHMGGALIADKLYDLTKDTIKDGDTIVEIGCWLGATTYPIMQALGFKQISYISIDRWKASESEVRKAGEQGVEIRLGQNLLPMYLNNIAEVTVADHLCFQKEIKEIQRVDRSVKMLVLDAGKKQRDFELIMRMIRPQVMVLQDYFSDQVPYQREWMKDAPFELIDDCRPLTSCGIFKRI